MATHLIGRGHVNINRDFRYGPTFASVTTSTEPPCPVGQLAHASQHLSSALPGGRTSAGALRDWLARRRAARQRHRAATASPPPSAYWICQSVPAPPGDPVPMT